jgi:hypothetical protein
MSEKRYAELELVFGLGGIDHKVRAVVSGYGAVKIFDFDRAKAAFGELIGKVIRVKIGKHNFEMYFTREFNGEGRFYNLKFTNMDEKRKAALKKMVNQDGMDPPWQRVYPRLDAISHNERVAVPSVAVVKFRDNIEVYRVLNFTLGGCLLESSNPAFEPLELGVPLVFDLRISNGEEITGVNGRLVRIGFEKLPEMDHRLLSLGVKIIHMRADDLEKYRYLIRTYCEVLRS